MLRRSGSSDAPEEYKPRLQGTLVVNDLFAREVAVVGGQRGSIRQDAREVLQERGLGDLLGTVRGIAGDLTTGFRTCLAGVGDCPAAEVGSTTRGIATPVTRTTGRGIASQPPYTPPAVAPSATNSPSNPPAAGTPITTHSHDATPSPDAAEPAATNGGSSGNGGSAGSESENGDDSGAGSGASSPQPVAVVAITSRGGGQNFVSSQTVTGYAAIAAASSAASVASRSSALAEAASALSQGAAVTLTDAQGSPVVLSGTAAAASLASSLSVFLTANSPLPTNVGADTESRRRTMSGFRPEGSATPEVAEVSVYGSGSGRKSVVGPVVGVLVGVLVLTAGLLFLFMRRRRRTHARKTLESSARSAADRTPSPVFAGFPVTFSSSPSFSPPASSSPPPPPTSITPPSLAHIDQSTSFGHSARGSGRNDKSSQPSVFADGFARHRPPSPTYSSEDLLGDGYDGDATIIEDPFRRSHLIVSPPRPSSVGSHHLPYVTDIPVDAGLSSSRNLFEATAGTKRDSQASSFADSSNELDPFRDTPAGTRMGRSGSRSPMDLRTRLARMSQMSQASRMSDGSSQVGTSVAGTSIIDFDWPKPPA